MTSPESGDQIMEREANQFAMELLMPREWLLKDLKDGVDIDDEKAIAKLAKRYGVSTTVMCFRIGQLINGTRI